MYIYFNKVVYSFQTLLSSRLLSQNLKIKLYKTIMLPVVLCGCEKFSLVLREWRRLRVLKGDTKWTRIGNGEGFTMKVFIVFTVNLM